MHKLIKSLLLVTAILMCFTLTGCSTTAIPEEPVIDETEEIEEPEPAEEEPEEEEEEPEEKTTQSSKQSTTSGGGIQYTVKMEIDGVVETDKNEGWWKDN